MLLDRSWGFDVPVVNVRGTPGERADQVQARLPGITDTGQVPPTRNV